MNKEEQPTERQLEYLKHMLGAQKRYSKKTWGFRNHFCTGKKCDHYADMKNLERLGLVRCGGGDPDIYGDSIFFFATEAGCLLAGLTKKRTKEVLTND